MLARAFHVLILIVTIGVGVPVACALDASELALVVNRNMPDGMRLAQLYAKQRQVPDRRIIELDLPSTEQMSFESYERDVVPPIRQFLRLNDPEHHIKCLVTFYGVPFRIGAHVDTPEETVEIKALHAQARETSVQIRALVQQAETMAVGLDPSFKPFVPPPSGMAAVGPDGSITGSATGTAAGELNGVTLDQQAHRLDHAGKSMVAAIQKIADPISHQTAEDQLIALVQKFNSPVQLSAPTTAQDPSVPPADPVVAALPLEDRRFDPAGRREARERMARATGIFGYTQLILAQIAYLSPADTESATDSELSLLWYTYYPRPGFRINSLCFHVNNPGPMPTLMVARLDAPNPQIVQQMILDSVEAENRGLQGRVVLDARGLPLDGPHGKPDSYAIYDDSLRQLAALIHLKTKLQLTFDDNPDVLPPHSVQDVSVYCGWYSVGKYVPSCSFVPGAVGYHMASFEMVSLRDPGNTGWVRGLLNDGVAATIGPVSEPYLQAFPLPAEFFPLLLTGKLTLAEVYWKTEVMASWRMCLVGDPLYNPFKNVPALKVTDLPLPLQVIFAPPAGASSVPAGHIPQAPN